MTVLYSWTVMPEVVLPADRPPAAGWDEGEADLLTAASENYVGENASWLTVNSVEAMFVTVYLAYHMNDPLPDGAKVHWDWGDGTGETADPADQEQTNQYERAGSYRITATVERPGDSALVLTVNVVINADGSGA